MGKKIAVVTGASSGLGREFVRQLAHCTKTLEEVWVIARRKERLSELKEELQSITVRVLPLDICREDDLAVLALLMKRETPRVRLLVNAAGVGKAGCFADITEEEALDMVRLNAEALVAVTKIMLPYMMKNSNIIQMASASAFLPQKEFAVYAASKSFVLSFSRALNSELKERNIVVTAVCPGPVETEFLEISNGGKEPKPYKKMVTVKPEAVVQKALKDAKAGKAVSVYGIPMKVIYFISRLIP